MTDLPDSRADDATEDDLRLSLWWAPLDISASSVRGLTRCLSPEERDRARRYRDPVDKERFTTARGWLRHLLGRHLRCSPGDVPLVAGAHGKPGVDGSDLRFSAARSAGMAFFGTSWRTEIGVDIEAIRSSVDIDGLAARFFSPTEQKALSSIPPDDRRAAAFQCWTRKEAYVKGIGVGLDAPLNSIDVWVDDSRWATVSGWTLHQVDIAPGFAASVAGAELDGWIPRTPRQVSAIEKFAG